MESQLRASEWLKVRHLIFSRAETKVQVSSFHGPWGQICRSYLEVGIELSLNLIAAWSLSVRVRRSMVQ